MKPTYKYKFSIVMAIYNTEKYLEEAILSVIDQDIGFIENVQLILVNDGSTDRSEFICRKYQQLYPDNIIYIKKNNAGVSSARNEGMKVIEGKYMNFLDSDDKLHKDALKKVYCFFEQEYKNINVVSIPIEFFEGKSEEHILNYKYKSGTRVIDLKREYNMVQLSSSSAFIKSEFKERFKFSENMKYAEDAEVINKVLLETDTLGVVGDTKYLYRFRKYMSSATQIGGDKKEWYIDYIKNFSLNLIDYCIKIRGVVPKYIQFTIMYDLQWRINRLKYNSSILDADEKREFLKNLNFVMKKINVNIIMKQDSIKLHRKLILILFKIIH